MFVYQNALFVIYIQFNVKVAPSIFICYISEPSPQVCLSEDLLLAKGRQLQVRRYLWVQMLTESQHWLRLSTTRGADCSQASGLQKT